MYCADGKGCLIGDDCASGLCSASKCVSCTNNIIDGDETDINCGGTNCGKCTDICVNAACKNGNNENSACMIDNDCLSGRCFSNMCVSCTDGIKNGNETSIDCGGGGQCKPCKATGNSGTGSCLRDTDCLSERCEDGLCVSCSNNIKDSDEGDIDCGGMCQKKCKNSKNCQKGSDCLTSYCDTADTTTCKDPPADVHCENNLLDENYGETDSENILLLHHLLLSNNTNSLSHTILTLFSHY